QILLIAATIFQRPSFLSGSTVPSGQRTFITIGQGGSAFFASFAVETSVGAGAGIPPIGHLRGLACRGFFDCVDVVVIPLTLRKQEDVLMRFRTPIGDGFRHGIW